MVRLDVVLPRVGAHLPGRLAQFDPAPHPMTALHVWVAVTAAITTAAATAAATQADHGRSAAEAIAELALADLTDAHEQSLLPAPTLAAARTCAVLGVAHGLMTLGDAEGARSWLVRGLGGSTATVTEINTAGPVLLLQRAAAGDPTAQDAVASLAGVLFPLSQFAGYLPEVLDPLADSLIEALLRMPPTEAACDGARAALTWAHSRQRVELVGPLAGWCQRAAATVDDVQQSVALLLALAATRPAGQRGPMLQALRRALPAGLPASVRLPVVVAAAEGSAPTGEQLDEAVTVIDAHWQELGSALGAADLARLRERTFATIGPLLTSLSLAGQAGNVLRVLQHWLGVPEDATDVDCLLLEHVADGVRYVWPGGTWLHAAPAGSARLDEAVNAALGTALASTAGLGQPLHTAASGFPDRPAGLGLEQACRDLLGLATAPETAPLIEHTLLTENTLLVPVPGHRVPYQALLADATPHCPPLWTSLRRPRPERWPQTVVLWAGDTALSAVEATVVADILTGGGFDVTVVRGAGVTVASVAEHYADPDVDVLWVSCHGRQPPYQPETADLMLRAGQVLTADDLRAYPPDTDNQRLLVLNSCDAAATITAGGLRGRGLAAEAAGPRQAVIGHQWVVQEQLAATFGALLAGGLVEHRGARTAFGAALAALRLPGPDLVHHLAEYGAASEQIAAMMPPTGDFRANILDWGAPALYC